MYMRNLITFLIGFCSASLFVGCSSGDNPLKNNDRHPIELTRAEADIAQTQYDFSLNLLKAAFKKNKNENVTISPLSASMVLGMLANAVDEEDREELLNALNVEEQDVASFNSYAYKLMNDLPHLDKKSTLSIANSCWYKSVLSISENYDAILAGYYVAETNQFPSFNITTVSDINAWIKEKTNGQISDLLDKEDILYEIKVLWLNSLYFKGSWTKQFDKSKTAKESFYPDFPSKGVYKITDMMHGGNFGTSFDFVQNEGDNQIALDEIVRSALLSYGNESFMFVGILPPENNPSIEWTLEQITPKYWQKLEEHFSYFGNTGGLNISLPKMNIDKATDLIPVIKEMGVKKIFESNEFGTGGVNMENSLGISHQNLMLMRQKVILDVNEEGTELKVATVAGTGDMMDGPLELTFNRPFIYFVFERSTGAILLAGIYSHP